MGPYESGPGTNWEPGQQNCLEIAESSHHLRTVQTTAKGSPFSGSMNTALCDF